MPVGEPNTFICASARKSRMQEQIVREGAQVAGSLLGSTADRPIARGAAGRNDPCQYGSGNLLPLQRLWLIMALRR
jgi:hypothetical protein